MKIALSIVALLVISTFAMALAFADDSVTIEDSIASETVTTSTEVTDIAQTPATDTALNEVSAEVDAVAPTTQALTAQQRYLGVARVTVGDGFVVKSDNTEARRITAFWVSSRYISVDPATVKSLREQYKGQPAKLKEEIAKLATDKVVAKATGRLHVGLGNNRENFKLMKKEFTNTSVSFYVILINENIVALKDASDEEISAKAVGTLVLDGTKYPSLTVWKGTLTLNSGKNAGTWSVTASSGSKVITHQNLRKAKAAITPGAKPEVTPSIAKATPARKPLLRRLAFWIRD